MTTILAVVLLLVVAVAAVRGSPVRALDGFGHAVAWWAVLKLPSHVQSPDGRVVPTPCDCPAPDCSNVPTAGWPALETRATGLCYLYADAKSPQFRHFRDVGLDCLGQGGDDPVSHTLKQKETDAEYWALFNDQLNGIAGDHHPNGTRDLVDEGKRVCGGGDLFSAHAKGAVAFQGDGTGGFFLQTSTPNFPDPTHNDSFVRLGCQADNNVQFAQHMLAMSVGESELKELGQKLQLARLCSGNFFRDESLCGLLGSASLFEDGPKQENTSVSAFYHALLDPELPEQQPSDPMKAEFRLKLLDEAAARRRVHVFEPLEEHQQLQEFVDDGTANNEQDVLVLVKSPRAAVPPWALVAKMLDSDVSVASWWDGSYGIPTICAGDVFTDSPHEFCLNDPPTGVELNADGSAPYNIENLMQARWRMSDGSGNLTWQLVGGRVPDGNHAKWGLTTPHSGHVNTSNAYAVKLTGQHEYTIAAIDKLFADGPKQKNTSASAFYHALLDPELPEQQPSDPMKAEFRLKLLDEAAARRRVHVFEPLEEHQQLQEFVDDGTANSEQDVLVLVKSPRAAVPPWALVAKMLDSDVSVASWWDGSYGIPTICAGDVFTDSPHEFCLNDPPTGVELNADGSAPYNIENLMQARWRMSDGSGNLTWQLVGGRVPDGNHAKWGLTTPHSGHVNTSNAYVTFGDLNMAGFPEDASFDPVLPIFEELRMCHRGCIKKIEEHLEPTQLPTLSANASSFWSL
ncbi:dead deah box rna [Phytophthora cinnamomi]|uniref:dead deah box rna n=1 Tax=Phytophthora cinnamomi TaxID=4785 RepID=UPI00355A155E|nr:dead deah box rna [Phytophthora cinnamomi]